MAETTNERVAICLQRYDQCLAHNFRDADTLARTLCSETGLWPQFCKGVIANHGHMPRMQIRMQILEFLRGQAQEALYFCRHGKDRFHDIYDVMDTCQYFLVIFCGPKSNRALVGKLLNISREELDAARLTAHTIMDINANELYGMVMKFAAFYVERCRSGYYPCAHHLALLGADYNLDIKELGPSVEEVRQWIFAADLLAAKRAYSQLLAKPLHALMADVQHTAEHLQIVTNCLEPDENLRSKEGYPWYMHSKPVTAKDLGLEPVDVEYIQCIQREFQVRDSP
jgi:hypothetical protein